MNPDTWARIKEVFAAALLRPRAERPSFVDAACGTETALRDEVRALLEAHDRSTGFLETPALIPAREVIGDLPAPLEGRQIGPFRLTDRLGAGGMGVVYRGERVEGGYVQEVAIKLIALPFDDAEALSRFRAERQILANLAHPNVVAFIDGGLTDDRQAFLVMELVHGAPITAYCRGQRLDLASRLRLFETICRAVHYAHQHGVVHRDLKPGNILVSDDGVVKVLDFGVAKLAAGGETDATVTGLLRPMTPDYASPEQLRGLPVTTSSDIYALGVLLYELIAGSRPYETTGQPLDRVLALVATEDPQRPSQALARAADRAPYDARQVRGDLDAIVLKAMRKDPEARYASAQELAEDLVRYRASEPVIARERSLGYLIRRAAKRHRAAAAAAVISIVAVVAALGVSLWQTRQATRERDRAEARFNDARALAQALIYKVHDQVANLPGSTPVRKLIVDEALVYLERLSQDPSVDDGLRRELAAGYKRIAEVQGNPSSSNLGDRAGARASYEQAVRLLAPLADRANAEPIAITEMGGIELNLSDALAGMGDSKGALARTRSAIARAEALVAREPELADARSLLANGYFRLAGLVPRPEALPLWTKAGEIYGALLQARPEDYASRRNIALVEKYVGAYHHQDRNFDEARVHYLRAQVLDEQALASVPNNRIAMFDIAIDYGNVASVDLATGRYAEAAEGFRRSLKLRSALAQLDPQDVQAQVRVAFAHGRLSNAYLKLRQMPLALAEARRAVEVTAPLGAIDGNVRVDYASSLWSLAEVLDLSGDRNGACRTFHQAAAVVAEAQRLNTTRTARLAQLNGMADKLKPLVAACK